ncbi:hypothetical protein K469DRAFT_702871 [Zopfia rhizophila CBS 207.26]|uniref:Uncharacterized protein n=1 Tax=Zopfia rhizophila CBS 207.26 TaxID=1314779 RepID=A0A6A6D7X8_9PEZI|nr:hypothetical protein K469DRAFT_702871 [Zopfia rhizophila CBS 207.26]
MREAVRCRCTNASAILEETGGTVVQSHREVLTVQRVESIPPSTANVTSGKESVKVKEGAGQGEKKRRVAREFVAGRSPEVRYLAGLSVCKG